MIMTTKLLINCLKQKRMPKNYKIILVDVKSLFASVPLDETRSNILRKIFDKGKKKTSIPRKAMKALLIFIHKKYTFHIQWRCLYAVRWCGYAPTIMTLGIYAYTNADNKQIISRKLSLHTNYRKINIFRFNGNYKSRTKRKISDALYIKALKPTLNIREKLIGLGLYS